MAPRGCVAAGHPETARAAEIVLREGGNAFDAVLAAFCAASVAEPILCSLGGGGFLLARTGDGGAPRIYDFFAHTPRRRLADGDIDFFPIMADFGGTLQEFHVGRGSMAAPGAVKGIFDIHRDLGRMPIREVLAPAIEIARNGVEMIDIQAFISSIIKPILLATPDSRALFADPDNPENLLPVGARYKPVHFDDFLATLAVEGADLFYRGEVAQTLVAGCRAGGGGLTLDDLAGYKVIRRDPLAVAYRGARIYTNPPPSAGGILIAFALELMAAANLAGAAFGGVDHLRALARVMDLTNKARLDAGLHDIDPGDAAGALLDPAFLARYRAEVAGNPASLRGTTHMSVIDRDGNAASMTVSNGEGCGYVIPGTGIMMNNMLGEEDINPHGFNRWPEDTRMTSMMSPSLLERDDGEIVALGSGGSNRIRTAILQVLVNHLDLGQSLQDAVANPRIHKEGEALNIEPGFSEAGARALCADVPTAQVWDQTNMYFGGVHGVAFHPDHLTFDGAGDPRRGGITRTV